MIPFNHIPANLRLPGTFIEFDPSLAGNAQFAHKVLFIAESYEYSPPYAPLETPVRVTSAAHADALFGRESLLAGMLRAAKAANPWIETWAIAINEGDGYASGSIAFNGEAYENGSVAFYIGGQRVRVPVLAGDDATTVAAALADAIDEDESLPVLVDNLDGGAVFVEAQFSGECGNDIDLRLNYHQGERLPNGLEATITPMAGGGNNPDITAAIAAMGNEWWNWIVCPYTDAANMEVLEQELDSRWGPMRQLGARAFVAIRGSHGATAAWGDDRNSPHVTAMGTGLSPTPPWIWASVNAVVAGGALALDPARPVRSLALPGVLAPAIEERFTDEERNTLLWDGISTYTVAGDGRVHIERQITQYQETSAGVADDAYLEINVPETLDRVRYEQRARFAVRYPRHKLAQDGTRIAPGQPIMTPSLAKAELLGLYREMEGKGWVQGYERYAATLIAEVNADDPTRLDVQDSPQLVGQYLIHAQQTQFRR